MAARRAIPYQFSPGQTQRPPAGGQSLPTDSGGSVVHPHPLAPPLSSPRHDAPASSHPLPTPANLAPRQPAPEAAGRRGSSSSRSLAATVTQLTARGAKWTSPSIARELRRLRKEPHPGATLPRHVGALSLSLSPFPALSLALAPFAGGLLDCGATNPAAEGQPLLNQCFYLSLAAAIRGDGSADGITALRLKYLFESAVRLVRGEHYDLQAAHGSFADFLVAGMTSYLPLRSRTVVVISGDSGTVEIYRSPVTADPTSPAVALLYAAEHYQWVRWPGPGPTAGDLIRALLDPGAGHPQVPHTFTDALPPAIVELDD